jgi:hypothetical protein
VTPKEFTLKEIGEILNGDPNLERSMKVRQGIENFIRCYLLLYKEKEKDKIPPDNYTPIFIQERIIVCMYSLYINKD